MVKHLIAPNPCSECGKIKSDNPYPDTVNNVATVTGVRTDKGNIVEVFYTLHKPGCPSSHSFINRKW